LWALKNRTAFMCTATSNRGLEVILHDIVDSPVVMKFPSEYELTHKVSPSEGSEIKVCADKKIMMESLENDIGSHYDEDPIIIIADQKDFTAITKILLKRNWNKYRIGITSEVLREIRSWTYGILIMEREHGLGLNTRFAKDSIVLIVSKVESKVEYL
jgi:hypothetical protein